MIEKVAPNHPDKVADRIAGALVDISYKRNDNPKVAIEVLIGHGECLIINETSVSLPINMVKEVVERFLGEGYNFKYKEVAQDPILAGNQAKKVRCGDNGIFKGVPLTNEEHRISKIARNIYAKYPFDGKYILDGSNLTICQSNASKEELLSMFPEAKVNPLGDWTGGINVDSGATNRKLGSDMAQSVTGGGLHGKDLSKADVSVNIVCFLMAQELNKVVTAVCSIGDTSITFRGQNEDGSYYDIETLNYDKVVDKARAYINEVGGFEKFAEWGLY